MSRVRKIQTRFRGYKLTTAGASFSYFAAGHFTLGEARFNDSNRKSIFSELKQCDASVDTLHITSWDADHCAPTELEEILTTLTPRTIECPGYTPDTDSGKAALALISDYKGKKASLSGGVAASGTSIPKKIFVTPAFIDGLGSVEGIGYSNLFYWPKVLSQVHNDNSVVKHFRSGCFNVLSLGDLESNNIANNLRGRKILQQDVDVMLLAHHGGNNGFTTKGFLQRIRPKVAICLCDFDNKFDHPKPEIRQLLERLGVPLITTKHADVIIESTGAHDGRAKCSKNNDSDFSLTFTAKKREILSMNDDTLRQRFKPSRAKK